MISMAFYTNALIGEAQASQCTMAVCMSDLKVSRILIMP
jgi:hypothetical protein